MKFLFDINLFYYLRTNYAFICKNNYFWNFRMPQVANNTHDFNNKFI